ncbi:hypothetical protein ACN267_32125 [Micromonospora sp. WMMD734]|uniref:hypothetical protein n=1 Tax=Micromonospora sp. WMMD734 TaxID=3404129 RepID=UPI003B923153
MAVDRTTLRDRVNARLRRMGLPDTQMPTTPTTAVERAAARLRRLGLIPVADQQTNQQRSQP